jgi:hypothetical protein
MGGGNQGASSGSSTQVTNQTVSPADWINNISQQFGNKASTGFNQSMNQANQIAGSAPGMASMGNSLTGQGGVVAGQAPNMFSGAYNQAQQSSQYNPNTFQQSFMNPYTQNVAQQTANIAQRDFNQQTAPSLMGQMGASGQFGSGRAQNALALAQAQNQQNVNNTVAGLMNQGYQQAQQNYLTSMQTGIQGANAMSGAGQGMAGAGQGLANIGNTAFQQGTAAQQLPGQTFQQYAFGLRGLPYGTSTQGTTAGTQNAPAQSK